MYISDIRIENIKCFVKLILPLNKNGKPYSWNVFLGNNSTGKTCLLRCIAIGLCDTSSGAALMKELGGKFLRDSSKEGIIELSVFDPGTNNKITINTTITQDHGSENIKQDIKGDERFLREKLFLCGYGIQRVGEGDESYESYSALEAVYTLFNYYAKLQNPELILLRQKENVRQEIFRIVKEILLLNERYQNRVYDFNLTKSGIEIQNADHTIILSSWADGYRSTFTWLLDFIGWQIYADRIHAVKDLKDISGIVLIDELELNLHPSWQRYFIKKLKEQFPKVQFIATSHSPIIASGVNDFEDSKLIALKKENGIIIPIHDLPSMRGMRADQVLTSVAFGLYSSISIGSMSDIDRFSELMRKDRNPEEEREYQILYSTIEKQFQPGDTDTEKTIEKAVDDALENILKSKPSKELDLLMKAKLHSIIYPSKKNDKN